MRKLWNRHPALTLFFFTLLVRSLVIAIWLRPGEYLRWLPQQHDLRAVQLTSGEGVFHPEAWSSYYLVLGATYAPLQWLGMLEQRLPLVVASNVLFGSLSVAATYQLSRLFLRRRTALMAGLVLAGYYPAIYLNALVMSENVFTPSLIGAILLLVRPQRTPRALVGAGLLLGLSAILRPLLLPFLPLAGLWLIGNPSSGRVRVRTFVTFFLPLALVILTGAALNQRFSADRRFSLAGYGGANFALAQCEWKKLSYQTAAGDAFWFSPPAFWNTTLPEVSSTVPFAQQDYYYRLGWNCLKAQPQRLIKSFVHLVRIFYSTFYPDFVNAAWHRWLLEFWSVIAVVFLLGSILYWKRETNRLKRRRFKLLGLLLLSLFLAVYAANPGEERYLTPYFFVLVIGAFALFDSYRNRLGHSKMNKS